ncbi:Xanthine dehydrogenase/oxidase [Armadillidium vulgare]|nr:Xanthine dehydrogenase/oxidase [Armadillidium vulgare]
METNVHIAVPYDNNELHLIGTSQSPAQTQLAVAQALGLDANRVYFKVKIMGGGFGGKESRLWELFSLLRLLLITYLYLNSSDYFSSLSTQKLILILLKFKIKSIFKTGRPVRICLSRQDEMIITGGRNPVLAK